MAKDEDDNGNGGGEGGFRHRLYQLRRKAGWSQSEVARRIWGETVDGRGYTVAKNRDRISAYEGGRAEPTRENLEAIAELFGVTLAELAPDMLVGSGKVGSDGAGGAPDTGPSLSMKSIPGSDKVMLRVNLAIPMAVALQVLGLLQKFTNGGEAEA
jgi:transcriptional regulator with XRE-family HTH domain